MEIDVNSITCPQCGGNNIKMESEISGVCQSCGTRVYLSANEEDVKKLLEKDDSGVPKVFEIPAVFSEKDFVKTVLCNLEKDSSPADVFNAKFSEPEMHKREVLAVYLKAKISYTASVGYDRKEQYIDYEDQYNSNKHTYEKVEVVKNRTVTDWSPFSGDFVGEQLVFLNNGGKAVNTEIFARDYNRANLKQFQRIPDESAAIMKINEDSRQEAFYTALDLIGEQAGKSLPGDRYSDLTYRLEETYKCEEYIYLVPEYSMNFTFNDKTYRRAIYPILEGATLMGDSVYGKSDEISLTCWNQVKGKSKLLLIIMIACFIFSLIPVKFFIIIGILGASVIGIHYLVYARKIYKKAKEDYSSLKHELMLKKLKEFGINA